MIKVKIVRVTQEKYTETMNYVVSETPTDKTKEASYGNAREVLMEKKYEPREVTKTREVVTNLLEQELSEENFNLSNVIKAVNGL